MRIEPITCLRPTPERVAEFAALPYDVFTNEEARAFVAEHPTSFLAIDRPETSFDEGQDPYEEKVYAKAQQLLRERQLDGTLVRDEKPCFYIYEQRIGDHVQRGLMGAIAVDDYLDGTLRQHELTLPTKERDRVNHITKTRAQTGPVFVAYPDSMAIDFLLEAAHQASPLYDFVSVDGVHQRVWRIAREIAVEAISVAFSTVECGYIADGHHRAAAAVQICQDRRNEGRENDPAEAFLAVLFPASQLRILAYDRIVADTNGLSEGEFLDALRNAGFDCELLEGEPTHPQKRGDFHMHAFNKWYVLRLSDDTPKSTDPVEAMDVSVLQNRVLAPILGINDPRTNERISFFGGESPQSLANRAGEEGIAFLLYPTSVEELMAVSDAGELMPPKSTWFDPKLLSGLALRRIW